MSLGKVNQNQEIELVTDVYNLFDYVNEIIKRLYGDSAELTFIETTTINKVSYYLIKLNKNLSTKIINDLNLYDSDHQISLELEVDKHLVNTEEGLCSFVKALTIIRFLLSHL